MNIPMKVSEAQNDLCRTLCETLQNGIDMHRCAAAQALGKAAGKAGNPAALDTLVAALLDQDEDVRVDAAAALARQANPRAGAQLLENLLGDPARDVKLHAIDALVQMRHPEVAPWLRKIVQGRSEDIVWADPATQDGWDDWSDVQVRAIEGLAKLNWAEAIPDIVQAIGNEECQDLTDVGFSALAQLGEPGIRALLDYANHPNTRRRRRAVALLVAAPPDMTRRAIDQALHDPQAEVRIAVGRALAKKSPEDGRIAVLFSDTSAEIRAEMIRLCGQHHPRFLRALLTDKNSDVVLAVLGVLATAPMGTGSQSTDQLRHLLRSKQPQIVGRAAEALGAIEQSNSVDDLIKLLSDIHRPVAARLGALNALAHLKHNTGYDAVASAIGDPDRQIRLAALTALAGFARQTDWPNEAGDTLLTALTGGLLSAPECQHAEPRVEPEIGPEVVQEDAPCSSQYPTSTLAAITGEARQKEQASTAEDKVELTRRDLEFLSLTDRSPRKKRVPLEQNIAPHIDIRCFAARVLADVAQDDVARALAEQLANGEQELQHAAAQSLADLARRMGHLPDPAIAALIRQLSEPQLSEQGRDIRRLAVRALGLSSVEALRPQLIAALDDADSLVRAEAVRAVTALGGPGNEIEHYLSDRDASVRLAAAEALAANAGDHHDIVATLVDFAFAHDGCHRRDAARLLAGIDGPAAIECFIAVLNDEDRKREWSIALEALGDLGATLPH